MLKYIYALILSIVLGFPALAQQSMCVPYEALKEIAMGERYQEQILLSALHPDNSFLVVLVNPDTGTWTAVRVLPADHPRNTTGSALACLIASGEEISLGSDENIPPPGDPV